MLVLGQDLEKKLKRLRVRVDAADADTILLRNVPARGGFFNKSRTNLLIKRPGAGLPFLVCVDEDLEYTGPDGALLRSFSGAHSKQGWRVIYFEHECKDDPQAVVEHALRVLGFGAEEPALERAVRAGAARAGRLLASAGVNITSRVREGRGEVTIGRAREIEQVVSALLQWRASLPVLTGESGVGKTNLVYGVAHKLSALRPDASVVAIDLGVFTSGTLFDSERENLLAALLDEAAKDDETVLVLEHLELALSAVPRGPWMLADAVDRGVRLMGTMLEARALDVAPLARRVQLVELCEPWPEEVSELLTALKGRMAEHHHVEIDETAVRAAVEHSQGIEGRQPAKAVALLDAACAAATLSGKRGVGPPEVYLAAAGLSRPRGAAERQTIKD